MPVEVRGYRLSPKASRDLAEIWRYTFDTWSLEQADRYYRDLIAAMEALADGARRGRRLEEFPRNYLSISSGSHFIIYRETKQQIIIVRILHQRMSQKRHL